VVVLPADEAGVYTIVAEHRRRDGCIQAETVLPAIIRDLSNDQLELMATVEAVQCENRVLADEVRAVAGIAAKHGTKRAGELPGKKMNDVSKMVKISKSREQVMPLLDQGDSNDTNAFYALSVLCGKDAAVGGAIVERWLGEPEQRVSLRARVSAARAKLDDPAVGETPKVSHEKLSKPSWTEPAEKRTPKVCDFEPAGFTLTCGDDGTRQLVFDREGGDTVVMRFTDLKWGVFTDEINDSAI
jgi:ParB-like chromosome segregation protein Spo0J